MPGTAAFPFESDIDLKSNEALNCRLHLITGTGDFSTVRDGMIGFNTGINRAQVVVSSALKTIPFLEMPDTISGAWTFDRGAGIPPFIVAQDRASAGDTTTMVAKLSAQYLSGYAASGNHADVSTIALRDAGGRLRVATASNDYDATPLIQVMALIAGRSTTWAFCHAASPSNVDISSGPTTIDGVGTLSGKRVLLHNQTTTTQNGIYLHNGNGVAMTRATDADESSEFAAGKCVFIDGGDTYANKTLCVLDLVAGFTLGTDTATFTIISGAGSITAGSGLGKNGDTLFVKLGTLGTPEGSQYVPGGIVFASGVATLNSSAALTGVLKGNGTGAPTAMTGGTNRLAIWSDANTIASDANLTWSSNTLTFGAATSLVTTAGAITVQPVSGSNLNVTLATTGDLAVNTNQLYVDTSAARVGINKSNPICALDVVGSAAFSTGFNVPEGTDSSIGGTLSMNTALSTTSSGFAYRVGGLYRWILDRGGTETGSNAGSDLTFYSYNDAGGYLRTHLQLVRSTGASNFAGAVSIPSLTVTTATTLTGFTSGSVLFAGASSVISQDNANLFWDDTNNRLCLGTTTSVGRLTVYDDTAGDVAFIALRHGTNYGANLGVNTDGTGDFFIATVIAGTPTRRFTITRTNGYCGINQSAPTSLLDITKTAIGVTQSDAYGLSLNNTTAAAAGAQQYSPPIVMTGRGWKTDATAASQTVAFRGYVVPVQGAANPTGYLTWEYSVNGAAYAEAMRIDTSGLMTSRGKRVARIHSGTLTAGSTTYNHSHGLATTNILAMLIGVTSGVMKLTQFAPTDTDTCQVKFNYATTEDHTLIVVGY